MGQYKCCCCFPIRAGVLIIALLSTFVYTAATTGLILLRTSSSVALDDGYRINEDVNDVVYYIIVAVTILFALASIFGVFGSITQNRNMIRLFKVFYWVVVILEFIMSVALLITLGVGRSVFIENCAASATEDACSGYYRNMMIALACGLVVANAIQFYFATAVSSYATRLRRTTMHEKLRNLEDFPEPPTKPEFF